jgi:hypothetical protein
MSRSLCARVLLLILSSGGSTGLADDDGPASCRVASPRDCRLLVTGIEVGTDYFDPGRRVDWIKFGDEKKRFRRLLPGDVVQEGQLIGRLDDRLAREELKTRETALQIAETSLNECRTTRELAEKRLRTMEKEVRNTPSGRGADYEGARLTVKRWEEEVNAAEDKVTACKAAHKRARADLATYEIRSPATGVVIELCKDGGTDVRAGEALLRISVWPSKKP